MGTFNMKINVMLQFSSVAQTVIIFSTILAVHAPLASTHQFVSSHPQNTHLAVLVPFSLFAQLGENINYSYPVLTESGNIFKI